MDSQDLSQGAKQIFDDLLEAVGYSQPGDNVLAQDDIKPLLLYLDRPELSLLNISTNNFLKFLAVFKYMFRIRIEELSETDVIDFLQIYLLTHPRLDGNGRKKVRGTNLYIANSVLPFSTKDIMNRTEVDNRDKESILSGLASRSKWLFWGGLAPAERSLGEALSAFRFDIAITGNRNDELEKKFQATAAKFNNILDPKLRVHIPICSEEALEKDFDIGDALIKCATRSENNEGELKSIKEQGNNFLKCVHTSILSKFKDSKYHNNVDQEYNNSNNKVEFLINSLENVDENKTDIDEIKEFVEQIPTSLVDAFFSLTSENIRIENSKQLLKLMKSWRKRSNFNIISKSSELSEDVKNFLNEDLFSKTKYIDNRNNFNTNNTPINKSKYDDLDEIPTIKRKYGKSNSDKKRIANKDTKFAFASSEDNDKIHTFSEEELFKNEIHSFAPLISMLEESEIDTSWSSTAHNIIDPDYAEASRIYAEKHVAAVSYGALYLRKLYWNDIENTNYNKKTRDSVGYDINTTNKISKEIQDKSVYSNSYKNEVFADDLETTLRLPISKKPAELYNGTSNIFKKKYYKILRETYKSPKLSTLNSKNEMSAMFASMNNESILKKTSKLKNQSLLKHISISNSEINSNLYNVKYNINKDDKFSSDINTSDLEEDYLWFTRRTKIKNVKVYSLLEELMMNNIFISKEKPKMKNSTRSIKSSIRKLYPLKTRLMSAETSIINDSDIYRALKLATSLNSSLTIRNLSKEWAAERRGIEIIPHPYSTTPNIPDWMLPPYSGVSWEYNIRSFLHGTLSNLSEYWTGSATVNAAIYKETQKTFKFSVNRHVSEIKTNEYLGNIPTWRNNLPERFRTVNNIPNQSETNLLKRTQNITAGIHPGMLVISQRTKGSGLPALRPGHRLGKIGIQTSNVENFSRLRQRLSVAVANALFEKELTEKEITFANDERNHFKNIWKGDTDEKSFQSVIQRSSFFRDFKLTKSVDINSIKNAYEICNKIMNNPLLLYQMKIDLSVLPGIGVFEFHQLLKSILCSNVAVAICLEEKFGNIKTPIIPLNKMLLTKYLLKFPITSKNILHDTIERKSIKNSNEDLNKISFEDNSISYFIKKEEYYKSIVNFVSVSEWISAIREVWPVDNEKGKDNFNRDNVFKLLLYKAPIGLCPDEISLMQDLCKRTRDGSKTRVTKFEIFLPFLDKLEEGINIVKNLIDASGFQVKDNILYNIKNLNFGDSYNKQIPDENCFFADISTRRKNQSDESEYSTRVLLIGRELASKNQILDKIWNESKYSSIKKIENLYRGLVWNNKFTNVAHRNTYSLYKALNETDEEKKKWNVILNSEQLFLRDFRSSSLKQFWQALLLNHLGEPELNKMTDWLKILNMDIISKVKLRKELRLLDITKSDENGVYISKPSINLTLKENLSDIKNISYDISKTINELIISTCNKLIGETCKDDMTGINSDPDFKDSKLNQYSLSRVRRFQNIPSCLMLPESIASRPIKTMHQAGSQVAYILKSYDQVPIGTIFEEPDDIYNIPTIPKKHNIYKNIYNRIDKCDQNNSLKELLDDFEGDPDINQNFNDFILAEDFDQKNMKTEINEPQLLFEDVKVSNIKSEKTISINMWDFIRSTTFMVVPLNVDGCLKHNTIEPKLIIDNQLYNHEVDMTHSNSNRVLEHKEGNLISRDAKLNELTITSRNENRNIITPGNPINWISNQLSVESQNLCQGLSSIDNTVTNKKKLKSTNLIQDLILGPAEETIQTTNTNDKSIGVLASTEKVKLSSSKIKLNKSMAIKSRLTSIATVKKEKKVNKKKNTANYDIIAHNSSSTIAMLAPALDTNVENSSILWSQNRLLELEETSPIPENETKSRRSPKGVLKKVSLAPIQPKKSKENFTVTLNGCQEKVLLPLFNEIRDSLFNKRYNIPSKGRSWDGWRYARGRIQEGLCTTTQNIMAFKLQEAFGSYNSAGDTTWISKLAERANAMKINRNIYNEYSDRTDRLALPRNIARLTENSMIYKYPTSIVSRLTYNMPKNPFSNNQLQIEGRMIIKSQKLQYIRNTESYIVVSNPIELSNIISYCEGLVHNLKERFLSWNENELLIKLGILYNMVLLIYHRYGINLISQMRYTINGLYQRSENKHEILTDLLTNFKTSLTVKRYINYDTHILSTDQINLIRDTIIACRFDDLGFSVSPRGILRWVLCLYPKEISLVVQLLCIAEAAYEDLMINRLRSIETYIRDKMKNNEYVDYVEDEANMSSNIENDDVIEEEAMINKNNKISIIDVLNISIKALANLLIMAKYRAGELFDDDSIKTNKELTFNELFAGEAVHIDNKTKNRTRNKGLLVRKNSVISINSDRNESKIEKCKDIKVDSRVKSSKIKINSSIKTLKISKDKEVLNTECKNKINKKVISQVVATKISSEKTKSDNIKTSSINDKNINEEIINQMSKNDINTRVKTKLDSAKPISNQKKYIKQLETLNIELGNASSKNKKASSSNKKSCINKINKELINDDLILTKKNKKSSFKSESISLPSDKLLIRKKSIKSEIYISTKTNTKLSKEVLNNKSTKSNMKLKPMQLESYSESENNSVNHNNQLEPSQRNENISHNSMLGEYSINFEISNTKLLSPKKKLMCRISESDCSDDEYTQTERIFNKEAMNNNDSPITKKNLNMEFDIIKDNKSLLRSSCQTTALKYNDLEELLKTSNEVFEDNGYRNNEMNVKNKINNLGIKIKFIEGLDKLLNKISNDPKGSISCIIPKYIYEFAELDLEDRASDKLKKSIQGLAQYINRINNGKYKNDTNRVLQQILNNLSDQHIELVSKSVFASRLCRELVNIVNLIEKYNTLPKKYIHKTEYNYKSLVNNPTMRSQFLHQSQILFRILKVVSSTQISDCILSLVIQNLYEENKESIVWQYLIKSIPSMISVEKCINIVSNFNIMLTDDIKNFAVYANVNGSLLKQYILKSNLSTNDEVTVLASEILYPTSSIGMANEVSKVYHSRAMCTNTDIKSQFTLGGFTKVPTFNYSSYQSNLDAVLGPISKQYSDTPLFPRMEAMCKVKSKYGIDILKLPKHFRILEPLIRSQVTEKDSDIAEFPDNMVATKNNIIPEYDGHDSLLIQQYCENSSTGPTLNEAKLARELYRDKTYSEILSV